MSQPSDLTTLSRCLHISQFCPSHCFNKLQFHSSSQLPGISKWMPPNGVYSQSPSCRSPSLGGPVYLPCWLTRNQKDSCFCLSPGSRPTPVSDLVECWSWLTPALRTRCAQYFSTLRSVTCWQLEARYSGRTYTTKINKCHKLGLFPLREPIYQHTAAQIQNSALSFCYGDPGLPTIWPPR